MATQEPFEIIGNHAVRRFDSVRGLIDYGMALPEAEQYRTKSGRKCGHTWVYGTVYKTRAATLEALNFGKTTPRILESAAQLSRNIVAAFDASDTTGMTTRRLPVWSDYGDEADADRVLERHERPWRTSRRGKTARVIRIGVNIALSCGNSEESWARLIGTACGIADAISRLGHGSEIVGMMAIEWGSQPPMAPTTRYAAYLWPVKSATEPMDIERVGSLGIPGLFRDFGFEALERDNPAAICKGYARID